MTEGEDIVFTLTRTAVGLDQPLTAYVNVYTRFYAGSFDYSEITSARHEVVFEAGAATATLVRATVDETANDGNSLVKALLNLGQYRQKASTRAAEVWIRNDDIPTVTMLVDAFEYVETGSPIPVTAVRTGDTTYDLPMMFQYSVVDNFPEWILTPNYLDRWSIFTGKVRTYGRSDNHLTIFDFGPGESTETIATGPGATTPFGSTFRMQILPRYCDEVPGDCHYLPQYRVGALDTTVVELLNDGMGVRVVADEVSVSEGEAASFTLHRYGNRRADRVRPLTVRVQVTQDGEFIEGVPPQTVTFGGAAEADLNIGTPDGEMSTTITIPTSDDLLDEADGAITLTILPPDQDLIVAPDAYPNIYGLADTTIPGYANASTVAVTDNDIAGVQIADAEAHEGAGTIDFTVTLQESAVEVTVGWMTTQDDGDDAATEGDDYSEASGVLTFAPGETSKTVSVTLLDDDVSEPDETFSVELLNPSDVSEESLLSGPATGTIFNDDAPQDIDAQSAAHGPVEEGQDVVFHLERFNLNSGDRDRVKARARLVLQVEITQEGDVIRGAAPTEVVFEQGSWTATVTVRTDDDDLLEPTGTVSLRVVGVGTFVQTFATPIAVTVWDNDNPLSIANAGAGEDEGEIVFTVSLGEPAARQITVNAATIDGTATSHGVRSDGDLGRDFWAKSETLTFQPGEQTKTFSVTLVNDLYDEESKEIFTVRLSNPVSARLQDPSAKGRITDNDDPMYVRLSEPPPPHPEDTELVRFSLGLNHLSTRASERDVVIEWTVTPGTATPGEDYLGTSGVVVMTSGNLVDVIDIIVVDDDLFEARTETFTLTLTSAENAVLAQPLPSFEVRIRDDERLSARVAADAVSVSEGEDAVFTVSLEGGTPTGPVEIVYTVSGTAGAADYTAPSGALTIPAGSRTGSITIPTLLDNLIDPDETLVVELVSGVSSGRSMGIRGGPATTAILDEGTLSASVAGGEAAEGAAVEFTVTLSSATDATVEVQWETATASGPRNMPRDDAATTGVDYESASSTVTVPAGDTSATFTVATIQDTVVEGEERFRVMLTRATRNSASVPLGVFSALGAIADDDDPPTTVTLAVTPSTIGESDGETELSVTATLNGTNTLLVDTGVSVAVAGGTATKGDDYTATEMLLTIPAGQLSRTGTLLLTPVDDLLAEGDETAQVTGKASGLTVTPADVTITDDDDAPTGVTLTVSPAEVGEGSGATELVVTGVLTGGNRRDADTPVTLSVEGAVLTLTDGGTTTTTAATATDDFTFAAETLTIPAGSPEGTVRLTITPVDDQVAEGDETAQVTGTAAGLTVTPAPVTIADNDLEPTSISLSLADSQVAEGAGTADLQVTATLAGGGARTEDTSVSLSVHDVTASHPEDYTAPSGVTLTIPAGSLSSEAGTLTLTLVDDDLHEGDEQIAIRGTNSAPGLQVNGVRATIADNDAAPTGITLSLDRDRVAEDGGWQALTVTAALDGTSKRTVDTVVVLTASDQTATQADYSAPSVELRIRSGSGEGTATLLLNPADDDLDEDDETFLVTGSAADPGLSVSARQVTITDDDTAGVTVSRTAMTVPEGGSNTYTVVLDTQPSADVTVTIGGHSGSDVSPNPASLTFTPSNWSVEQTVTVSAAEDDDALADDPVTLTHTVSGGDYAGLAGGEVAVTVSEDETAGVTVSRTAMTVAEGGSDTYTVVLDTPPSADVTVAIGGHSGSDVSPNPASLTFTPSNWSVEQTVTVRAAEDDDALADDPVTLTHTVSGGDYAGLAGGEVAVTVSEDETAGVTVSRTEMTVAEGGSDTYTVVLDTPPSADVTVAISGHSGSDVSPNPASLTFTPSNWSAEQTVTVSAAEDDDALADDPVTLTHTVTGGDYEGLEADRLTVTIEENDTPTVAVSDAQASEADGAVEFEVTLSIAGSNTVTVAYETSDGTAAAGNDYIATNGTLTFPAESTAGQTIRVPVTDAPEFEAEQETFTLTLSGAVNAALAGGGATLQATGTIIDDDNAAATGSPPIAGVFVVGQTITAGAGDIADANGLTNVAYAYQWVRVESDDTEAEITGATSATYVLTSSDVGKRVKVQASFTDDDGFGETLTSGPSV